jgi:hypothetical protein
VNWKLKTKIKTNRDSRHLGSIENMIFTFFYDKNILKRKKKMQTLYGFIVNFI